MFLAINAILGLHIGRKLKLALDHSHSSFHTGKLSGSLFIFKYGASLNR
jgi:hypothetical protein